MSIANARDQLLVARAAYDEKNPQVSIGLFLHALRNPSFPALMNAIASIPENVQEEIETFDPEEEQQHDKPDLGEPEYTADDSEGDDEQDDGDDSSEDDQEETAADEDEKDEDEPAASPADEGLSDNDADKEIEDADDDVKEESHAALVRLDPRQRFAAIMTIKR